MWMTLALVATATAVPGPSVHVGDAALLFSLSALNEDAAMRAVARPTVALSDFTGVSPAFPAQVVAVHFLRRAGGDEQLQALGRLHKRYAGKDVRVVAIVVGADSIASVSDWVQGQRLEYPVLNDAHGIVASRYGVSSFPMTFVVDGQGDVLAIGQATSQLEGDLDAVIAPLVSR